MPCGSLGLSHAEIAAAALFKRAALLVADTTSSCRQTGQTANDRFIIGKSAVSVEFMEVRKDRIDIVERVRALRMASHKRALPGISSA